MLRLIIRVMWEINLFLNDVYVVFEIGLCFWFDCSLIMGWIRLRYVVCRLSIFEMILIVCRMFKISGEFGEVFFILVGFWLIILNNVFIILLLNNYFMILVKGWILIYVVKLVVEIIELIGIFVLFVIMMRFLLKVDKLVRMNLR